MGESRQKKLRMSGLTALTFLPLDFYIKFPLSLFTIVSGDGLSVGDVGDGGEAALFRSDIGGYMEISAFDVTYVDRVSHA